MQSLLLCNLCGKAYNPNTVLNKRGICGECLKRLDDMYSGIHKYITAQGEIDDLTLSDIARELEIDPDDVRLLYDLGYFDRDLQTYSRTPSKRYELAKEFEHEIEVLKEHAKITTYGGLIYRRKSTNDDERSKLY